MKKIYITGTDTEIGKTYFSGLLCKELREKGNTVCYVKPVQTGYPADDDAKTVAEMSGITDYKVLHTAEPPVAPYIAFEEFPFEETVEAINAISGYDYLVVESAGGLMVPLDSDYMNYDLARECGLSCIVVVPNRLGCINHAMLNKHFLENEGIQFEGFAMNNHFMATKFDRFNISMLNDLTAHSVRYVFSKEMELSINS
ncbi:MAG: dethiobiotin synthase [Deferribacterales bacterium]